MNDFKSVSINDNQHIRAYFKERKFRLYIKKVGSGRVTGDGIDCGNDCYHDYRYNTTVTLTAVPNPGFLFTSWEGDRGSVTNNQTRIVMNGDKTVIAVFCDEEPVIVIRPTTTTPAPTPILVPTLFTLTVLKDGMGYVTDTTSVINCGSTCIGSFLENTQVILPQPTPDVGWEFDRWSGNGIGILIRSVFMNADKIVTAHFIQQEFELFVEVYGNGYVRSNPIGIDCNLDCREIYVYGTSVNLIPTPLTGYQFLRWEEDIIGTSVVGNVVMDDDKYVRAIFGIKDYLVTVRLNTDVMGQVFSSDGNISCPGVCEYRYNYNSQITLSAYSNEHYEFDRWSNDLISKNNTDSVTILPRDMIIYAHFKPKKYRLKVTILGEGSVSSTPRGINRCDTICEYFFSYGSVIVLSASGKTGWEFVKWTNDLTSTLPSDNITITGNKDVTAIFQIKKFELEVVVDGQGDVQSHDNLIDCPVYQCIQQYDYNTSIDLFAVARQYWDFKYWQYFNSSHKYTLNNITVLMNTDKKILAKFEIQKFKLTVLKVGEGTVTSTPSGINCGYTCNYNYDYLTMVDLTAVASTGYQFSHWTGDISGTSPTVTLSITRNKTVTAHFTILQFELTVSLNDNDAGYVVSNDSSINCPDVNCIQVYDYNTTIQLSAISYPFYTFDSWSGDISGTTPLNRSVTINQNKHVIANFSSVKYRLRVFKTGLGTGTVESTPSGINCGNICDYYFDYNTMVELTAVPATECYFVEWNRDLTGTSPTRSILVNEDKIVEAKFDINFYNLTIEIVGSGSVLGCTSICVYPVPYNSEVELEAFPSPGQKFIRWEGDLTGTGKIRTIVVKTDKFVRAIFEPIKYTVRVSISETPRRVDLNNVNSTDTKIDCPNNVCSAIYYYGDVVTLIATPGFEYHFKYWRWRLNDYDYESDNPILSVSIFESRSFAAYFQLNRYLLTVTKTGLGSITGNSLSCGDTCQVSLYYGTNAVINAYPSTGWLFSHWIVPDWTGDPQDLTNSRLEILIDKNRSAQAIFIIKQYDVNVLITGGVGSVISSDSLINCPTDCYQSYQHGTSVTLTASPAIGNRFLRWDNNSVNPVRNLSIIADRTIEAIFEPILYKLTITYEGQAYITSNPIGIDCGLVCEYNFNYHQIVTINANAAVGYELELCVGDYQSIDIDNELIVVLMNQNKTLHIKFIPREYSLQVRNILTEELGTIISDIDNCINCRNIFPNNFPAECNCDIPRMYQVELISIPDEYYQLSTWILEGITINKIGKGTGSIYAHRVNTDLIITPDPFPGYVFCGWTGQYTELLQNNSIRVPMNQNKIVEACFSFDERSLTVIKHGDGNVFIISDPAGIYIGNINQYTFTIDSTVLVLIYLQPGTQIISIIGDYTYVSPTVISVNMNSHKTIEITVEQVCHNLKVENLVLEQNGTIYSYPFGIECGTECEFCMPKDEYIELQAIPNQNYQLQTWVFEGVKIHKAGLGYGSVYINKDSNKLYVTPDPFPGYVFCGWTGNYDNLVNSTIEINIDPTKEVYCCFGIPESVLTIHKTGDGNPYIVSEPSGIYYGTKNSYPFQVGTTVLLTVYLPSGVEIEEVIGDYLNWNGNNIYVKIGDSDIDITIKCKHSLVLLDVINLNVSDTTNNKIISYPEGISCPSICQQLMPKDEYIELQASPEIGYHVSSWEIENILINKIGDGFGTFYTNKIDNILYVTPDPYPGYSFNGWSGDIISINGVIAEVSIGTPKTINGEFTSPYKTLTINKINTNSGNSQIVSEPFGIDYGTINTISLKQNSKVLLISRLFSGTIKTLWFGDFTLLEDNVIEVILDDDKVINIDYQV